MISDIPSEEIIDQTLWRLHFAGGQMCVAESAAASYLVLFTSPERAEAFMRQRRSSWDQSATPALYSATRAEFMAEAGDTAAHGLDGTIIDPDTDGRVLAIIDFCRDDLDLPEPPTAGN
jgi:hypothetical protein